LRVGCGWHLAPGTASAGPSIEGGVRLSRLLGAALGEEASRPAPGAVLLEKAVQATRAMGVHLCEHP
jgi:hypothetical protein